ncbi:reverse transcriptase domain-containing protein [Tanacetum coccineum]
MICLQPINETISSILFVERKREQSPISYVSRPLQELEICYTLTEKAVLVLIHTIRYLRKLFRTYKVSVVTDGPMEEVPKGLGTTGKLALWAVELRTYHISYIQRKEAEGQTVKKFSGRESKCCKYQARTMKGPLEQWRSLKKS